MRQKMLAWARIQYMKKKLVNVPDVGDRLKDISQVKSLGSVQSWIEITKLLEKKHSAEREVREFHLVIVQYHLCKLSEIFLSVRLSSPSIVSNPKVRRFPGLVLF